MTNKFRSSDFDLTTTNLSSESHEEAAFSIAITSKKKWHFQQPRGDKFSNDKRLASHCSLFVEHEKRANGAKKTTTLSLKQKWEKIWQEKNEMNNEERVIWTVIKSSVRKNQFEVLMQVSKETRERKEGAKSVKTWQLHEWQTVYFIQSFKR